MSRQEAPTRLALHPVIRQAWSGAFHTLTTGEPGLDGVVCKKAAAFCVERPSPADVHNALISGLTAQVAPRVIAAYDFSGVTSIVDVGGGDGSLVRAILRANPGARGIILDLPKVRAQAVEAIALDRLGARCRFVTADAFADPLPTADAYLLKPLIHGWDNDACRSILRACRVAMHAASRVLLLVGRGRSVAEQRALLEEANLQLEQVIPMPGGSSILDARRF